MAPAVAPLQGHFDGGEVSPLLHARVDSERYKSSLALCKNWIPSLQGGLMRKPGTVYVGATKTNDARTRLIPFEFSTTQSYVLEFGNQYIRFWSNYGQVQLAGSPYEIVTPYLIADILLLRSTQSADVLYLVHPLYPPMKLLRYGQTSWVLQTIDFLDGPYTKINSSEVTLTPSATSGTAVTVTAGPSVAVSSCSNNGNGLIRVTAIAHGRKNGDFVYITGVVGTTEANGSWSINVIDDNEFDLNFTLFTHAYVSGGTIFPAPFVGISSLVPIRLEQSSTWGWGIATGGTGGYQLTVNVKSNFAATTATKSWRIGLWGVDNYPGAVTFHEDRLCFSGTPSFPQRVDCSITSDYENMAPSANDGTVSDNSALSFTFNANDVNLVEWLNSDEKGILAGSSSAEWITKPSITSGALTSTNISAKRSSKWGSAALPSLQVGKATLYVQRGARKIRELQYYFDIDGYRSTDLTELAEHITGLGVTDITYQAIPFPILWLVRKDGALLGMTYDRDMSQLRVGWHWHVLGGRSDASGTPAKVNSIATIPSPDGTRDDLWMLVSRYVNGSSVQYVEYMSKIYEDIDPQTNAFFVDCGATYNVPKVITGATQANPVVITSTAHGFSNGDTVRITDVVGMTQLNGQIFTVAGVAANTFQLSGVNGSGYGAYISGGNARKLVSAISGLSFLEGETVAVFADGATQSSKVVSGGAITLDTHAAIVSIGYSYNSDGKLLRFEAGARNGTSLGKTRREHRAGVFVHRSSGLTIGKDFSNLDTFNFDNSANLDPDTGAEALFSGIASQTLDMDYDFDNQICFRVSDPVPCTILGFMPQMETQDRA